MNFLKSGWSYLSNSFTQSESDEDESNLADISKSHDLALNLEENSDNGDHDNETNEFVDAVDTESHDLVVHTGMCERHHNPPEISVESGNVDVNRESRQHSSEHTGNVCEYKPSDRSVDVRNDNESLMCSNIIVDEKGKPQGYVWLKTFSV